MVDQEKKAAVSTPQTTALAPAAPTPTPAMSPTQDPAPMPAAKPPGLLTRETRLALVVLASFLALAAGVYAVKVLFKSKQPADPTEVAQGPQNDTPPQMPQQLTKATRLEPSPAPETKLPPIIPVRAEVPMVPAPEAPPIILPPESANAPIILPKDPTLVLPKDPPIIELDPPMARKDGFTNAKKDIPMIEVPTIIDVPAPEVKTPVIRIGGTEPKKTPPLKVEVPAIPDPPLAIEVPPMKKNPPAIDPPLTIEVPPMKKTEAPVIDPPLTIEVPPMKKNPPAIDPPLTIEVPPMKKTEAPAIDPPLTIELPPMKSKEPSAIEIKLDAPIVPKKADAPANANDYDEDLHPFKKEDTYRSISKQYYNSDAYASALQRYNREHPGQADYVRVPPIWLLEKKYANDVAANATRSASYSPPPSTDLQPRNEQVYTVGDNGELLGDIAKKTLGSEEAWKRIWDLNPQLNPAKMIPGGTRLRLP